MQPGIYFGLSEEEYFAADALGSSDLKLLARSPADWWWYSPHNPLRPAPADSSGKRFGSALHKRLLEGSAAFDAAYYPELKPPPGSLKTIDELKEVLTRHSVSFKSSARKDDLVALVKSVEPSAVIFHEWAEQNALANVGKEAVSVEWFDAIQLMAQVINSHPDLKSAFVGGQPEVSVFWEEDGIPLRARFDYLKPHGVFDLKSISNWRGNEFRKACLKEIKYYGYGLQAAHYMDARAAALSFAQSGAVSGLDPQAAASLFGDAFAFVFVFMQTIGSPRAIPIVFPQNNAVHENGIEIKRAALENYKTYRNRYGLQNMWVEIDTLWQPSLDEWAAANFWS